MYWTWPSRQHMINAYETTISVWYSHKVQFGIISMFSNRKSNTEWVLPACCGICISACLRSADQLFVRVYLRSLMLSANCLAHQIHRNLKKKLKGQNYSRERWFHRRRGRWWCIHPETSAFTYEQRMGGVFVSSKVKFHLELIPSAINCLNVDKTVLFIGINSLISI